MKSFTMLPLLVIVYSAVALAHNGEDHNLPSAISVNFLSMSDSTGTAVVYMGTDYTFTTTIQPSPTAPQDLASSAISSINSILTDSLPSGTSLGPSSTTSSVSPTGSSTDTAVLNPSTVVSSATTTVVSPTSATVVSPISVSSTTISVTRSSSTSTATSLSASNVSGAAPTMAVGLAELIGLAAGVMVAL